MSGDPGNRPLLPQVSQMHHNFSPSSFAPRENQKNYVFVDEHNRHKRLKVMRACEGCRRRKIKCDAATTNSWPCSACVRLKLHCVPPTINYERDTAAADSFTSTPTEYENTLTADYAPPSLPADLPTAKLYSPQISYTDGMTSYQAAPYAPASHPASQMSYASLAAANAVLDPAYTHQAYGNPSQLPPASLHHEALHPPSQISSDSPETYHSDQYGEHDLADLLGDLRMDETGTAPYLKRPKRSDAIEEPVYEEIDEYKGVLPTMSTAPDMKIRIPPELMPDDETAAQYFQLYFDNVHPYVPVLNKTQFYRQWHTNRDAISPLILEAIFAIAGRLADEPAQGQQWLALVSKHADSFMDVSRLSTLQAMLMVLKARESVPKRGYYYRSWMTVVHCVTMAKDLGLDEHYSDHMAGRPCGSNPTDCSTKTRIWQTLFVAEVMVGSAQGRMDDTVSMDSLDMRVPARLPGDDESDSLAFRNFVFFVQIPRNVRKMGIVFTRVKKNKDWGLDPEFRRLTPDVESWIKELPADLQIEFPADGSPPWLPSHFVGNMHSYYYLHLIMLHRPQMMSLDPTDPSGPWKRQMMICYNAAKKLCRIQQSILDLFGLPGLLCMQRGINYTIYAILTCTVLHLVALTSPDPDLNSDARDFFTRHMRILETCSTAWPMPDMQQQIDSLRLAFSADVRKPFTLKASFPYGSPATQSSGTPPRMVQFQRDVRPVPAMPYTSTVTTPISAGGLNHKPEIPPTPQMGLSTQPPAMVSGIPMVDSSSWNPSRIFEYVPFVNATNRDFSQWNTTFGGPANQQAAASMRQQIVSQDGALHDVQSGAALEIPAAQQAQPQYAPAPIQPAKMTPSMWRESVARVYEGGLKREWDYEDNHIDSQIAKRMR